MNNYSLVFSIVVSAVSQVTAAEVPAEARKWMGPQVWQRDTDGPVLSLGSAGCFDDTHIFAPSVARLDDQYLMWYCGSRGAVNERVFRLGLATSPNGRDFERFGTRSVFDFQTGRHSVLTPTLLRAADGHPIRENGRLRMWFSSTVFQSKSGLHTLHESTSVDGLDWSQASEPLLQHVYAPTILYEDNGYRMWYVDVQTSSWVIRHATSPDGRRWKVTERPVVVIDQSWERGRLFYPTVIKLDRVYLMWYGSYWAARKNTTATGFAVSLDGLEWSKHPGNPVLRPVPRRSWESHYVTSQSVIRLSDGSFRIWYASRRQPPFVNKYFALNTAIWKPDMK